MPNILATIAILGWPLIGYALVKRLPIGRAIIWSLFLPFMFLPSGFGYDLPGLPPFDKQSAPTLTLMILLGGRILKARREITIEKPYIALLILAVIGIVFTALTNSDPIVNGFGRINSMSLYDGLSDVVGLFIHTFPFILGYLFLYKKEDHEDLVMIIFLCGFVYMLLALSEVRLSPFLHLKVYGYFPHSFLQHIRNGGWRPVVFQPHGLWLGFFLAVATGAATILWKQALTSAMGGSTINRVNRLSIFTVIFFCATLALSNSLAALFYGLFLIVVIAFVDPKKQLWIASSLAMVAFLFPLLRTTGVFPIETIVDAAYAIDIERGASLAFRFIQEDSLLDKANQRPLFGWGSWGRNRVYDAFSGRDQSVTDGYWIIIYGVYGIVGFVARFGLLVTPILLALIHRDKIASYATSGLMLMLAVNMIELLPNSTLPPWTWLISGSIAGWVASFKREQKAALKALPSRRQRTVI